jgi:hypothetical protein
MPNVAGTRVVWAVVICGAIVPAAEPHRTHVYQRWFHAGWSHAEVGAPEAISEMEKA